MGYHSFSKVLSPLITRNLYNYQLYSYLKDKELKENFKPDTILDNEKKHTAE